MIQSEPLLIAFVVGIKRVGKNVIYIIRQDISLAAFVRGNYLCAIVRVSNRSVCECVAIMVGILVRDCAYLRISNCT